MILCNCFQMNKTGKILKIFNFSSFYNENSSSPHDSSSKKDFVKSPQHPQAEQEQQLLKERIK